MPGVSARGGGRRRRTMNEINMVPFIDVMLVLLIIFMVSAPLITTGLVDLPSVGNAPQKSRSVIEVVIGSDEKLKLKRDGQTEASAITLRELVPQVKRAQDGNAETPVVISADRQVKYEAVVKVMDTLQRNGVKRVGLMVRQGG